MVSKNIWYLAIAIAAFDSIVVAYKQLSSKAGPADLMIIFKCQ